jgi:uncharacterized surface protein with fasciclin (FAS1) repeats
MKKLISKLLFLSVFVFATISCKTDNDFKPQSIAEVLNDNKDFTFLLAAVKSAGMEDALKSSQLTLFAPNDAAFKASGFPNIASVTALPADKLRAMLFYHIVPTKMLSNEIKEADNQNLRMLNNELSYLSKNAKGVSVNGLAVITQDIETSNGVIHAIDHTLKLPIQNLGQIIVGNTNLSLFLEAINKVTITNPSVLATLSSTTNTYTVFAPSNAALESVGYNSVGIKAANPTVLANVLLYHIAQGRYFINNLLPNTNLQVLGGNRTLTVIKSDATGVVVRGIGNTTNVNLTTSNTMATNGVLHIVDKLLLP